MLIIYKISKKEVNRRRKAFLSLSISLFLGLILASILFNFSISFLVFGCLAGALFLVNLWVNKFFNKFLKMKICLSKEFLIKMNEKFLIKEINKIRIKRTTKNTVREMGFYFKDGKSTFINGLENFTKFKINVIKRVNKNAKIVDFKELIDFDHVTFYPVLGLLLGFSSVYLFKIIANGSDDLRQIILLISLVYVFLVGMYMVISKPISKRY